MERNRRAQTSRFSSPRQQCWYIDCKIARCHLIWQQSKQETLLSCCHCHEHCLDSIHNSMPSTDQSNAQCQVLGAVRVLIAAPWRSRVCVWRRCSFWRQFCFWRCCLGCLACVFVFRASCCSTPQLQQMNCYKSCTEKRGSHQFFVTCCSTCPLPEVAIDLPLLLQSRPCNKCASTQ